jgi:hypothetical protein
MIKEMPCKPYVVVSGWLMHVALMFVFVTMLLKTRRADKVSGAV